MGELRSFGISAATWAAMALNLVTYVLSLLALAITLFLVVIIRTYPEVVDIFRSILPGSSLRIGEIPPGLPGVLLLIVMFALLIYGGWLCRAVLSPRYWKLYALILLLFAFSYGMNTPAPDMPVVGQAVASLVRGMVVASLIGFAVIAWLHVVRVRSGDRLAALTVRLGQLASKPTKAYWRTRRVDAVRGLALVVAGFVVAGLVFVLTSTEYDRMANNTILSMCLGGGVLIVSTGLRYLQVSGEALLKADHRAPILLLRSFEQDERAARKAFVSTIFLLFIVFRAPLEVRLAKYFRGFGPFVAVGVPGETLPPRGAARLTLSQSRWDLGDHWQQVIISLMERSQAIVLAVGTTHSIDWELSQIVMRDFATRTILIFPSVRKEQKRDAYAVVARNFAASPWSAALAAIDSDRTLRAIRFEPDGELTVIRGNSGSDTAYHLATMVAHDAMRRNPVGDRRVAV